MGYVPFRAPGDGQRCRNWVPFSTIHYVYE